MSSSEMELEKQLEEAGNTLLQSPSLVDELLPLLDQVESFLSRVEQSPSKSMLHALNPSIRALVADGLLRHSDIDVKVAVASCISEITRITAPDAPYDDDKMKDVFQLIVASFENLSDMSSRSYSKRVLILETVAKVRSCVVMLDLECDELIIEMFRHFLKAIRDNHPENVFLSMQTIMTLVLEESEEISSELLSPILASLKRDEEIQPISRKLGEKVFEKCACKLKPYLVDAVKSLGISLNDYSKVVASVCEGDTGSVESNDGDVLKEQMVDESKSAKALSDQATQADESKLATYSSDEQPQVPKESVKEEAHPKDIEPALEKSPKSLLSNGVAEVGNDGTSLNSEPLKSSTSNDPIVNQFTKTNENEKAETGDFNADTVLSSESKPEKSGKRRGRKPISVVNSKEHSDTSLGENEKEAEKQQDDQKSSSKDVCGPSGEDPSTTIAENEKEITLPKALESEAGNVASPSASGSLPSDSHPKKVGRPKKKENKIQEDMPTGVFSRKASEGTNDSEVKAKRSAKKAPVEGIDNKISASEDMSKNEGGSISNSESNLPKKLGEGVDGSYSIGDGFSAKKEDGKRRGRGKAAMEKDVAKPTSDELKEMVSSPMPSTTSAKDEEHVEETPKSNSKRKHIASNDRTREAVEYGADLVGSKVKVWWPIDRTFYEGVIGHFDPVKKKHKVLYTDGDEEVLNLRRQRWEFIEDHSSSDVEQETEPQIPDTSSEMPRSKKAKANSESSAKENSESSAKHRKMEVSPKGDGAASSSKSKGTATKSGHKLRDDVDGKSGDRTSKSGGKPLHEAVGKLKDQSYRSGNKPVNDIPKKVGKSKDDGGTPKTITKSKQEHAKTAKDPPKTAPKSKQDTLDSSTKSKGKFSQSGNKPNVNGMGKVKSASSKVKQDVKDKLPEPARMPENMKGKSMNASKMRQSEAKTGKKRRRGAKS